jgi:hypothetical protein
MRMFSQWVAHRLPTPFSKVACAIVLLYVGLNVWYASMGYLDNIDERVRGMDGVFYYVYLPSIFFDQDLQFANNLTAIYGEAYVPELSKNGSATNMWAIGSAMMWAPFYLLAHALTVLSNAIFDAGLPANGYGGLYYASVYVANSIFGCLSVLICSKLLLRFFSPMATLFAAVSMLFATQLTYYICAFTATSHCVSLVSTALFFYMWFTRSVHPVTAIAAGLMIAVRWQNALYALPLAIEQLVVGWRLLTTQRMIPWLRKQLGFVAIVVPLFLPQMLTWWVIYDSPFVIPQGQSYLDFSNLPIVNVLFHSNHGLFLWHPVLLLGAFGVIFGLRGHRRMAWGLGAVFLLQLVLNAAVSDWNGAWSFGHRRFMATLPVFAIGLAALYDWLKFRARVALIALAFALSIWNQLFIFQFLNDLIPHSSALTFRQFVVDKWQLPRVNRAQKLAVNAIVALEMNQTDRFQMYAKLAYQTNPHAYNVLIVYALHAVFFEPIETKLQIFNEWHQRAPTVWVAKWGLAQCLQANNQADNALALFDSDEVVAGSLQDKVLQAIRSGKPVIFGDDFVQAIYQHIYDTFTN